MFKICVWVLPLAAYLLAPAATHAAVPLRVSFDTNVRPACVPSIDPATIQQAASERLTAAGITISNVHNAVLGLDLNCTAPASDAQKHTVAVDECLTFSEFVATPSMQNHTTLAPTWHACQSYTCTRTRCEPAVGYGSQLIEQFLGEIRERAAMPPVIVPSAPAAPDNTALARLLFYSVYIISCLTLIVYRGIRGFRRQTA